MRALHLIQRKYKMCIAVGLYSLIAINSQSQVLDASFGTKGLVVTANTVLNETGNEVLDMALQQDGKIVAAGMINENIQVVRYKSNGQSDSSFGTNGIVVTNFAEFTGSRQFPRAVSVLEDNKILVGGFFYGIDGKVYQFLIRYKENGDLDSSFGIMNNGKVVGLEGFSDPYVGNFFSMTVEKDGKILTTGFAGPIKFGLYRENFCIARYLSNGTIDNSFGVNGIASVVYDKMLHTDAATVTTVQEDQNILLAGYTLANGILYPMVARLKPDGTADSSFGNNGIVVTYFDSQLYAKGIRSLIVQKDGRIVARVQSYDGGNDVGGLIKYQSNGSLDETFGKDGTAFFEFTKTKTETGLYPHSIIFQSDEKILVCGAGPIISNPNYQGFHIVRYTNNGVLDSSFGVNGTMVIDFSPYHYSWGNCLALQQDGKVLAGGSANPAADAGEFALARVIVEGILATTWKDFTVSKKEKTVLLNWQTANESNNDYFSVERSANGIDNFYAIGKVASKGNGAQSQLYGFEDMHPLTGHNYYRLKQLDADGHFTYSKILVVDFANGVTVRLSPNPVKNILRIEGLNSTGVTSLTIVDLSGRVLAKATSSNTNTYTWNIQALPSGMYYVIISSTKQRSTLKLLKE